METTKSESGGSFNAPEVKLHFLDYWRVIRMRKTVILAVFLLVSVTAIIVTLLLPKSYASTARIAVEKDIPDVQGLESRGLNYGYDPYFLQTEFEKIESRRVLTRVIEALRLDQVWAKKYKAGKALSMDQAYMILKSRVNVKQQRNTTLIEITATSDLPGDAANIANKVADEYKKLRLENRARVTKGGIEALEKQAKEQDELVAAKQQKVNELRERFKISEAYETAGANGSDLEPEMLRKYSNQRVEGESQFQRVYTIYSELTNMPAAKLRMALNTAVQGDSLLTELLQREAMAQERVGTLGIGLGTNHQDFRVAIQTLITVSNQISDRVEGVLNGMAKRLAATKRELDWISNVVETATQQGLKVTSERRPYWQAKRDLESAQVVRDRLNMQITSLKVEHVIPQTKIVEIVDDAEPDPKPVAPKIPFNIALGLVVGLALGIGLAFFIEYLDTSVKTIDDVERALQSPVLGVIPQNVGLLIDEGPDSPHAEAYRVLRTNVLFSRKDPKLNTLSIVSSGAGEGKSTTLFNLAVVFAQNNQRVLIVDSDLRRPSLHRFLRLSNSIGLTNVLLRQSTFDEALQKTSLANLDFLASGKLPSSSIGVLSSVQMKEFIRDVKRRYDFVFFDAPPIMGVSDASIVASEVDMVLQVIQYRRYPQPMTIRAKQMIEKVGGNLLGIVLNNINMAQDENYYYYSGYYYDYYQRSDESKKADEVAATDSDKLDLKPKY